MVNANPPTDGQSDSILSSDWGFQVEKAITFDGGTANAIGDHDGTADPTTIFTVTGVVKVRTFAVVETTLVGAATIELGYTGATAAILAQVANATTLQVGEIWHDATVDSKIEAITVAGEKILTAQDMIMTLTTANVTAGKVRFICHWYPLSQAGNVIAA